MQTSQRSLVVFLSLLLTLTSVAVSEVAAQERERSRDRGRTREGTADYPGRQREGGVPRGAGEDRGDEEGTPEGAPPSRSPRGGEEARALLLPPQDTMWRLGVYARNTDTGVVITQVVRGTAAQRAGLEPGDRIVAVGGFQIGYVDDQLFTLGEELQRQADPRGQVTLLVQNVRNQQLLNRPVQLDRDPHAQ